MGDRFFVKPSGSRKRNRASGSAKTRTASSAKQSATNRDHDEEITSESEVEDVADLSASESQDEETEVDKRRRLAKEYLKSLEEEVVEGFDAKDLDEDIINRRLKHDVAEQQGHIFRELETAEISEPRKLRIAARFPTAIASASATVNNTSQLYVGAKDGTLSKFQCSQSNHKPQFIRSRHAGGAILSIAVNTANKLVVTGSDKGFRVWNAESFEMLREFKLKCTVLSCVFRRNTNDLYVGGSDLRLRTYDLTQFAYVETLHGHQDQILGLSALNQERCVSVGARDRTAIFWKIPEESRLTFRGGDTKIAAKVNSIVERMQVGDLDDSSKEIDIKKVTLEGSIDCCAMLDHSIFVTGSDNGNATLWSTQRKKPQFCQPTSHGLDPALTASRASAETDAQKAEIPPQQPRSVTSIASIPFSNTFFTGSWSGEIKMWCLSEDRRSFRLVKVINVGLGIVTGLTTTDLGNNVILVAAILSREPRLGRWLKVSGHDRLVTFKVVG